MRKNPHTPSASHQIPNALSRRSFLRGLGRGVSAASLAAASMGSVSHMLGAMGSAAHAADTSGYKAIVCVFLFGGMDNHDTIIPYDQPSYDRWAQIRSSLLADYNGDRTRDTLLPLSPSNAAAFGDRQFALPQQLPGLRSLFDGGNAAIIGNVGPLLVPTTRESFFNGSDSDIPPLLFSHNDQQSTWMAGSPEGAQLGWGGRIADAVLRSDPNNAAEFTAINAFENDLFITGEITAPYKLTLGEDEGLSILNRLEGSRETAQGERIYSALREHLRGQSYRENNLIGRDLSNALQGSLDNNELFRTARQNAQPLATQFPEENFLAQQLQEVAQTIANRGELGVNRQVFFTGMGGYDTHSEQAADLPVLHDQLDAAISAFFSALQELGLENDVTLFTASDFGRTLAINGDGTDHGWGGHQFVVGGAVNGGVIYGDIPVAEFDHDQDVGGGRLVPTMAIEQYAAPIARWFGLNDAEVASAFPRLSAFEGGEPVLF